MNDFDTLCESYVRAHEKPDMKYSIRPTILHALIPLYGTTAVDVGCGDGFFSEQIARIASKVYGVDSSAEQIHKAHERKRELHLENIQYACADMTAYDYPPCDRICAPFVFNYIRALPDLTTLLARMRESLRPGGKLAGTIDMPTSTVHDIRKFGAVKRLASLAEGEPIEIELHNGGPICTLHSYYHTRDNFEAAIVRAGFDELCWVEPIISDEGMQRLGSKFWEGYAENTGLAYFIAR